MVFFRLQLKNESSSKFAALKEKINHLNLEIARRVRAEYELKNQREQLKVTLESIGDAVITTDSENHIVFMNPMAEMMTGWSKGDALGKALEDVFVIVNEYTGEPVENPATKAFRERSVIALANHSILISKHGKRIAIEDTASPIILEKEVKGVILVFHDVSERRLLEQQLMERAEHLTQLNHRKNQFLTMLAHELRSPLTPISNAIQIMSLRDTEVPACWVGPRQVIERQMQHLKRLVDDLLDVSRVTTGKMRVVRKYVNLSELAETVCRDVAPQFDEAKIILNRAIDPQIFIHADPNRMVQVLHNLLGNTIKYTPEYGSATLSLFSEESFAVLQLTDTGIGIEPSLLSGIFEPFTQAEQKLDRSAGGLGLGLSLVKGIVDLHRGTIVIDSKGRDFGTTITVKIPVADPARVDVEHTLVQKEFSFQRHKILIIEDNEDAANTMARLLELLGHTVYVARTGPEGVKKATALEPAVIICDIGLPGFDGFEVAKRLRGNAALSSKRLIALSGYGDEEFVSRALEEGFNHHITKPASLEDIEAVLNFKNHLGKEV